MKKFLLIVLLVSFAFGLNAQKPSAAPEKTRVLLILDCSQSMWDKWQSDAKIKVTQKVLLNVLDSIRDNSDIEVALRVFGHLNRDSYETQLEVPFGNDNIYQLQSKIKTLVPNGANNASTALGSASKDFPRNNNSRNIVLIITDGSSGFDNKLCSEALHLQQSGIVSQTYIVSIANRGIPAEGDCGGNLIAVESEENLGATLRELFFLSDQKALVALTLVNHSGTLYETEVPVVFYDHGTHEVKYANIYHYDTEHVIDTLVVDPLVNYDITIFTNPPLQLYNKHFRGGEFNRVSVVAPTGTLNIQLKGKSTPFQIPDYTYTVHQCDSSRTVVHQSLGKAATLPEGIYDIDIHTLPQISLKKVKITGGSAKDLQIPLPGQLALTKLKVPSSGSLFAYKDGKLQWVCNLDSSSEGERIVLMPGEYQLIVKPVEATTYDATRTARFSITSGKQTAVNLSK